MGLSQSHLARLMHDYGHKWYQVTVARTEAGQRPLRLDESIALAAILQIDPEDLYQEPSSEDEYEKTEERLTVSQRITAELEHEVARLASHVDTLESRAMDARARYQDAEREYETLTEALAGARKEQESVLQTYERCVSEVAYLRYQLERLQANRSAKTALRDLSPAELMDLTIKNVTGTRVTEYPDGSAVIEILVGPDKQVAARSKPFEDRREAAAAARAIRRTFYNRHQELGAAEPGETQEG